MLGRIYANVILTIIAIALSVIAGKGIVTPAGAQLASSCGDYCFPCHVIVGDVVDVRGEVTIDDWGGVAVYVQ